MDDKVMWLNAPVQSEIDLGVKHGFKVFPSYEDVIWASVNRTTPLIDPQVSMLTDAVSHSVWVVADRVGLGHSLCIDLPHAYSLPALSKSEPRPIRST